MLCTGGRLSSYQEEEEEELLEERAVAAERRQASVGVDSAWQRAAFRVASLRVCGSLPPSAGCRRAAC